MLSLYKKDWSMNRSTMVDFIDEKSPYGAAVADRRSRQLKSLRRPLRYPRSTERTTGSYSAHQMARCETSIDLSKYLVSILGRVQSHTTHSSSILKKSGGLF